jgi:lipoprotein-releasing system permease protein
MYNGIIIGFLGSTLGVATGFVLCYLQYRFEFIPLPGDIYFINKVPVLIRYFDLAVVYITANLICVVAASYPAFLASRLLPAESIRYE